MFQTFGQSTMYSETEEKENKNKKKENKNKKKEITLILPSCEPVTRVSESALKLRQSTASSCIMNSSCGKNSSAKRRRIEKKYKLKILFLDISSLFEVLQSESSTLQQNHHWSLKQDIVHFH
jgi:hypothetical protein